MILRTKDYSLFKFRKDNRNEISHEHVRKVKESLRTKNLLELRPILVNRDLEIVDGQHRFLAAKELGIEICYEIGEKIAQEDLVLISLSKSWGMTDYLNYYCENGYEEYLKLRRFAERHNLQIKVALNICMREGKFSFENYKKGKFVFEHDIADQELDWCWDTIRYLKQIKGHCPYVDSGRFWKALIKLVTHPNFKHARWMGNLERLVERVGNKATIKGYCEQLMSIYNWKNKEKVDIVERDI